MPRGAKSCPGCGKIAQGGNFRAQTQIILSTPLTNFSSTPLGINILDVVIDAGPPHAPSIDTKFH